MFKNVSNNVKLVALACGLVLIGLVIYFVFTAVSRAGKVAVAVTALPGDAAIQANGESIGTGTAYLKPGTYDIKAKKEGFSDAKISQFIDQDHNTIDVALNPVSDEALKWYDQHKEEYMKAEGKAGEIANKEGEAFRDKNPIVNLLPYKNFLYTIGYQNNQSDPSGNSIILTIDASDGYRQSAVYQISQWGYNPADYKIEFRNYKNPFTS